MNEPTYERIGPDHVLTSDGIVMTFSRVYEAKDETAGFLRVSLRGFPGRGDGDIYGESRLILTGPRSKLDAANGCRARVGEYVDWMGLLEKCCQIVRQKLEEGEPPVNLGTVTVPEQLPWLVEPLFRDGEHAMLYGPGGSAKSLLMLAILACLEHGADYLNFPVGRQYRTALIDWEDIWETHATRLQLLADGLSMGPRPEVHHKEGSAPLPAMVGSLSRWIAQEGILVAVFDSAGAECWFVPEFADASLSYYRALRSLGLRSSITIAHHSKADDSMPFGCYAEDTEILTKHGWLLHKDWHGEEILTFDPKNERMNWARPTKQWVYDHKGEMIHFKSPATDVLVTPHHRILVKAAWRSSRLPTDNRWRFVEAGSLSGSQWATPYSAEGAAPETDNEISDDMLRLIGWWVSEGSIGDNALQIAQAKKYAQPIADVLSRLDIPFTISEQAPKRPKDKEVMWYFRTKSSNVLARWMVQNCGSGAASKRLPSFISSLSKRQIVILLDALIDGDGSRKPNHRLTYTTNSLQLADDVQRLAIMAGLPAVTSKRKFGFEVKIGTRRELSIRKERHVSRESYDGKVYCFTVPSGAYLTRRNGAIAIQGNSVYWWNSMRNIWLARVAHKGENELHLGLFHKKANNGQLQNPLGLHITFAQDATLIEREDVRNVEDFAKHLSQRDQIVAAIRNFSVTERRGPTREELHEFTGIPRESLKTIINRHKTVFTMTGNQVFLVEREHTG